MRTFSYQNFRQQDAHSYQHQRDAGCPFENPESNYQFLPQTLSQRLISPQDVHKKWYLLVRERVGYGKKQAQALIIHFSEKKLFGVVHSRGRAGVFEKG
ncbi:hypothetical protein ZHAS_00013198 [Anopheles sinensis]|uniref:Uncharacterized protein n=1 Tax=Anopheles sinensis TaxID=74873 RepID=A0A084W4X8_ANOSI|nr:hypothetical protein ZHAS_00013198 [Anopheles sinensis]